MWEDLAVDTVASLMDTQGAIQSTSDAMAQLDSAAYDTLEEGMEAVISFDPAYRDQNIAIWQKAGQLLGTLGYSSGENAGLTNTAGKLLALDDFSLGSLANNTSTVIYYDFSGFTWSPQIQTEGSGEDADDFMARLKAHEAEFFDWLEEFIQAREVALYA